jgi:hypothetical protein
VEERVGRLELIKDRAAVVKSIFKMAANGYGLATLIRTLTEKKVPCFGRKGRWTKAYLSAILKDRRALGELQPKRGGENDGEVIRGYYPAVVTEDDYLAARAGAKERLKRRGRTGEHQVNIFAGLLWNARDGERYFMVPRVSELLSPA